MQKPRHLSFRSYRARDSVKPTFVAPLGAIPGSVVGIVLSSIILGIVEDQTSRDSILELIVFGIAITVLSLPISYILTFTLGGLSLIFANLLGYHFSLRAGAILGLIFSMSIALLWVATVSEPNPTSQGLAETMAIVFPTAISCGIIVGLLYAYLLPNE